MPVTIPASNGQTFHLYQLPNESAPEPEDGHEFTTLNNEMCDGFRSSLLFGLNTGVKSWKLRHPTLAGSDVIAAAKTDPYGATVSREDYIRNLFKHNLSTGKPFAYQDPNTSQYYLVDIVDKELSMKKAKWVEIFDSELEFRQRRINGITIFDVSATTYNTNMGAFAWYEGGNFNTPVWSASSGVNMTATGDVVKVAAGVNGEDYVQFNNSASTGYVSEGLNAGSNALKEFFLVMKMREATFSNAAGVVSGAAEQVLIGSSGTTKFTNPALSDYTYRLNGVEYAQSNLQAPMNAWGIVHVRYETGWVLTGGDVTLGFNDATDSNFAEVDIAEAIFYAGSSLPVMVSREITEYLSVKYNITI